MAPKHIKDVLQSSNVVRAQELLSTDQDIHKAVKDGFFELQHEIVGMRMARQIAKNKPDQRKDNGTHPAAVGLSVDLLSMSFVDGGLTALIATIAAWITKPNKKSRKK
mgnify:CR=1 FL=1